MLADIGANPACKQNPNGAGTALTVIRRRSSWKTMEEVELETLKWVDWFNNRRLLEPIGNIPPAEAEEAFYANLNTLDMVA